MNNACSTIVVIQQTFNGPNGCTCTFIAESHAHVKKGSDNIPAAIDA